jgi:tripartite ATP-independent transporter DctM subunit
MQVAKQLAVSLDSYTLLAITGFILAGRIMNSTGITDRIFKFANSLVGHITGGLAHANVVASIIFAGMSGSAIADAGGLGTVEIEGMVNEGFDAPFSAAVTAASALIGPIIPPSVVAIIYAMSAGVSVGRLFLAGVVPGVMMGIFMMILIYYIAKKRNYPKSNRPLLREFWVIFKKAMLPIMTPIIILGGIIFGIFTPTEAAAVAVAYAVVLGIIYKTVNRKSFYEVLLRTTVEVGGVGLLIAAAVSFSWVLTYAQVPTEVSNLLLTISKNPLVVLLIINGFLLIVGLFMDPSAAILVLTPIFLPVITELGIDPLHFGVVMILNLMIGLLTPPVGMVLYVISNIANVKVERLIKELLPFFIPLLFVLILITIYPKIVLFVPNIIFGN